MLMGTSPARISIQL
ncbi:hypothetical protein GBAR_LOCUS7835 [Geodia barretti]|uniref:Uncharacterized protein n=1 Tax=Geodia barretti TaxID=519541 RepID=A0AA35WCH3_GEOBA|nr:hypothetical protein GBAR_LOCUS7835 [Geodia barretti]